MLSLRDAVAEYKQTGKAIGHFNISDSNQLEAIAQAAKEASLPVIIGLSEGEREYFPLAHARSLVDDYIKEGIQMYLNADHTYGLDKAKAAIDAGVDSIVVDGAKLPLAENIALVKEVVEYSKGKVIVEGELGYIGQSSSLHDELPEGVSLENLTTPEDAKKLVMESGIDMLAPAVGNIHGMLKNAAEPRLHPDRVKAIAEATGVPLVLHGASGNTEDDVRACIAAGVAIVHINTELRVAYKEELVKTLRMHPSEVAPYKLLAPVVLGMRTYVAHKLRVFANK
ncbi:MAG: class II fructose-bisphosphate aldolase [Patescibacteria group bacterium]